MKSFLSAVVTGLSCLALSCGEPTESADTSDVFVAFGEDFRGYHAWPSFALKSTHTLEGDAGPDGGSSPVGASDAALGDAGGEVHTGTDVIEYINALPPSGSTSFPSGTMIVKQALDTENESRIFAMVKRGGKYNKRAPGWEWFEIESNGDDRDGVTIIWRGVGPPNGESYGGDPNGCNSCHVACKDNDSVCSPSIRLSEL